MKNSGLGLFCACVVSLAAAKATAGDTQTPPSPNACRVAFRVIVNPLLDVSAPPLSGVVPRYRVEPYFKELVRGGYSDPRYVLSREILVPSPTDPRSRVQAAVSLTTAAPEGLTFRPGLAIPEWTQARLTIQLSRMIGEGPGAVQSALQGDSSLVFQRLFAEDFLTAAELNKTIEGLAEELPGGSLADHGRVGTWRAKGASGSVSISIDLVYLTFAEFSALYDKIAKRIDGRANLDNRPSAAVDFKSY